jgi:2-polyprenyl-3-methyl-5-hydroxy-6-metoxy-1,4-benzoquinol methylase
MIKKLAKKALKTFGLQITRIPKQQARQVPPQNASGQTAKDGIVESLREDPLNGSLHLKLAEYASTRRNPYLAYAELKTAEFLGVDRKIVESKLHEIRQALPSPTSMNHNQYFRFISLSSEILNRAERSDFSVLDVGGGNGQLATFIPDASYCLAEPTVNEISGTQLPFPDHSFDYVVSCHVLEHIPVDERTIFLDQLMLKAKRGIILLNPFHVEGTYVDERLKLIIKLTGAQWAKEHLDCTLPKVQDIEDYANDKGLEVCIKPNGTMTTSMALVFFDYFATKAGFRDKWEEFNRFFNEKFTAILDSKEYPTAYLIYLGWPEAKGHVAEQSTPAEG